MPSIPEGADPADHLELRTGPWRNGYNTATADLLQDSTTLIQASDIDIRIDGSVTQRHPYYTMARAAWADQTDDAGVVDAIQLVDDLQFHLVWTGYVASERKVRVAVTAHELNDSFGNDEPLANVDGTKVAKYTFPANYGRSLVWNGDRGRAAAYFFSAVGEAATTGSAPGGLGTVLAADSPLGLVPTTEVWTDPVEYDEGKGDVAVQIGDAAGYIPPSVWQEFYTYESATWLVTGEGSTLRWSIRLSDTGETGFQNFEENSYLVLPLGPSDHIVKFLQYQDRMLVLCANSVWIMAGGDPIYWYPVKVGENVGISSPDAVVWTNHGVLFADGQTGYLWRFGGNDTGQLQNMWVGRLSPLPDDPTVTRAGTPQLSYHNDVAYVWSPNFHGNDESIVHNVVTGTITKHSKFLGKQPTSAVNGLPTGIVTDGMRLGAGATDFFGQTDPTYNTADTGFQSTYGGDYAGVFADLSTVTKSEFLGVLNRCPVDITLTGYGTANLPDLDRYRPLFTPPRQFLIPLSSDTRWQDVLVWVEPTPLGGFEELIAESVIAPAFTAIAGGLYVADSTPGPVDNPSADQFVPMLSGPIVGKGVLQTEPTKEEGFDITVQIEPGLNRLLWALSRYKRAATIL